MQRVTQEQLVQELAVIRKRITGKTAPYDRTIEKLSALDQCEPAPTELCKRVMYLAMAANRKRVEVVKASVGAVKDEDVQFYGATSGYLLRIARVLYDEPKSSSNPQT